MANMSKKDTYLNDTDGRDDGTEPSGHGSAASSEHDGNKPSQRGDADSLKHGNAELSDHDSAASPERKNTASSEHGDTASPERDNVTSLKHGDTFSSKRGNAPSPEHDNEAAAQRDGAGDVSSERGNIASPEHDDAIHDPKHATSAGEEALGRSSYAEETWSDDRSAAHAAKTACGKDRGPHAAKATSDKHYASHAAKAASAYLQKAGNFLGLHKKASAIAAAIALCAIVGIGAAVASSSRPAPNGILLSSSFVNYAANAVATTTNTAADEAAAGLVAQRLTPNALNSVDSFATAPGTFSLIDGEDSTPLSEEQQESLAAATQNIEGGGYTVGFTLINLNTGKGIAYNLDSRVYGASSFKGPYCAYVVNKEFPNDIDRASSSRLTQVENTIVWSDNSSYGKLRRTYGNDGMEAWLAEAGVDTALVNDTYFPTYTARQSALMWLKIYEYLTTADTSAAQWLSDTFGKTEVSFLRNGALGTTSAGHTDYLPEEGSGGEEGVEDDGSDEEGSEESTPADGSEGDGSVLAEDAEGGQTLIEEDKTVASIGTNITVRNKAGWIDGQDDDAVCDSGIVTINGRDYLITIMTNAPDSAAGEQAFAHLARTLLEIRGDLV